MKGFTLIELLIVIGIAAILSVVTVIFFNPVGILQQSRDATRLADLKSINDSLVYFRDNGAVSLGTANTVYLSIPDPVATSTAGDQCQGLGLPALSGSYIYHCAATSTYRATDGTGWIPVNFKASALGDTLDTLPIDPINTTSSHKYFSYAASGREWELTAALESSQYQLHGSLDKVSTDGGQLASTYELGTGFGFEPLDYGSPYGSFSKVQTGAYGEESGGATVSCVFGSNPTPGDLVVVASTWYDPNGIFASSPITSVQDGNSNGYTVSPHSPSAANGLADGSNYLAYLLSAPSNANKTITITFAHAGDATIYCDEFSTPSGYVVSFDGDVAGAGSSTGGLISTPTISVSGSNELLYAIAIPYYGIYSIDNPWSNGGGQTPPTNLMVDMAAYDLGASGSTTLGFEVDVDGSYDAIGAAFKATSH